jgi:FMN phosphatase YigB (HAD superfamily)
VDAFDAIDLDAVSVVLLDVGGVFLLPDPIRVTRALADVGLEPPDDHELLRRAHYVGAAAYDRSGDQPETWPAYHEGFAVALGYEGDELVPAVDALTEAWNGPAHEHWTWRQDDAAEALARLAAGDRRLGVVSNADGTIERTLVTHGICQVGDGPHVAVELVVDSGVVGHLKPDPAIFAIALEFFGVEPHAALYVGDTVRNDVRGAQAAGLPVVHLDPFDLHTDADHPRVTSLHEVADALGC